VEGVHLDGEAWHNPPMPESAALETHDLSKHYGRLVALDRLNLTVRPGEVYGLIGPNGAGKTTFLRLVLGLARPTAGGVRILGEHAGTPAGLARIGSVVEMPAFYPYLSGSDNLRVLAAYAGVKTDRIGPALERVGLAERGRDKVSGYSLGMRQRLGLAAAYLKDPELYLLDEPTNGLDPHGIAAMRDVIRELAQTGKTVLLSSHLLAEVEQVCDRIGIIHHGKLLLEETVGEVRGSGRLLVRATPLAEAGAIAQRLSSVERVEQVDGALRIDIDPARAAELNRELVSAGIEVSELRSVARTLEEVFLQLTGEPAAAEVTQ
jgi:ABC-type multidrug transport system ATPase subunit